VARAENSLRTPRLYPGGGTGVGAPILPAWHSGVYDFFPAFSASRFCFRNSHGLGPERLTLFRGVDVWKEKDQHGRIVGDVQPLYPP